MPQLDINLNNVIRSAAIAIVGIPLSLGASGFLSASSNAIKVASTESEQQREYKELRSELTGACLKFALSKVDSKMERNSKNEIDDTFGDGADYREVCKWVLE